MAPGRPSGKGRLWRVGDKGEENGKRIKERENRFDFERKASLSDSPRGAVCLTPVLCAALSALRID